MRSLKKIIQSDAAYEILDNSNCPGTTWMEGGCAILARALNMYAGYPMYVIFNKQYNGPEHFGVKTPSGSIIDGVKEYKNEFSWLQDFKENEFPREGELTVIPYTEGMGLGGVEFDEEASAKLAELIKNYSSIRKEVRSVLMETIINEKVSEALMGPGGKLIDFDFKFMYPYDEIWEMIRHYVKDNEKTWRQFGWAVFDSDYPSDKYKSDRFTFFRVEKIDDFAGGWDTPILDILNSDEEAYERAKKAGFILDEDGIVLGLDGVNLVDQAND